MNNNSFKNLINKVFYSGNPMLFYIGINVIAFLIISLLTFIFKDYNLLSYVGVPASTSTLLPRIYTVFTYSFVNVGFLNFLFNMLWLYWFGTIFMSFLKAKQFHVVYLGGALLSAIVYILSTAFLSNGFDGLLVGSTSAILAIIVATTTLVPNYAVKLIIFGEVKIKYIALVYIALDVLSLWATNRYAAFAHLGAVIFGFIFVKQFQKGIDWSTVFRKKSKLKVVKNDRPVKSTNSSIVPQQEIDAILDKISTSGYDKLSASEKEKLFKASNN